MAYGPDECWRDLEKVWLGTASPDEHSAAELHLLDLLRDGGTEGIEGLLRSHAAQGVAAAARRESEHQVVFSLSRDARPTLSIITFVTDAVVSVQVMVETHEPTPAEQDPLHAAFYGVWERLIGADLPDAQSGDPGERAVYLIATLEAELMNGGFGQYLTNTEGAHLSETSDLLERMGATKTRALLEAAVALAAGAESYVAAWDDESEAYSRLDGELMECGEDLAALAAAAFLGDAAGGG